MLDSCRADKVGAYGFPGPTTPNLDALAADADAVLYRWHFAQAPHTKASTASLFTGTYPFQHGVLVDDLLSEVELRSGRYREKVLSPRLETLAERLRRAGFRTLAAVRIAHLSAASGFARGFERFLGSEQAPSDTKALEAALRFLQEAEAQAPAFAYVHLRACHNPFPAAGLDPDYLGEATKRFDPRALAGGGFDPGRHEFKELVRSGRLRPTRTQIDYLHAVYEARLRRVDDRLVGAALDELRERGLYDRTLVVVTADHGEELVDHGSYAHGHTLWNEVLRVPLIVKFPRGERPASLAGRYDDASQAIDLMPSLLRFVGADPPVEGASEGFFRSGGKRRPIIVQAPGSWALIDLPWKAVVDTTGRERLFDLFADPGERSDVAASHPERLRRMVRSGRQLQSELPRFEGDARWEASEQTIDELRSLGYLQ